MRFTFIMTDGTEKTFGGITKIIKDGQSLNLQEKGLIDKLVSGRLVITYAGGKTGFIDGDRVKQILL